jgi:rhodanese-related sulfurtransferase
MPESQSPAAIDPARLAAFVPLNGLRPQHLEELARGTELVRLEAGHELIGDNRTPVLTYYLLEGELELRSGLDDEGVISAGSEDARFAVPGQAQGYTSIRARTPVRLMGVDRPRVSTLLILAHAPNAPGEGAIPTDAWAARLLRSELFSHVPPANVPRLFELMKPVPVEAGQVVVEQGAPGRHYYVIRDGVFEVFHQPAGHAELLPLTDLEAGDTFGEEALVSGTVRNATVRAKQAGTLMCMTKDTFVQLIQDPLLDTVDRERAEDLVRTGARWVDTRLPEEHAKNGIEGSINIPLSDIRDKSTSLDPDTPYVVYCNAGRRSAAAAFLLTQRGIRASVLAGGLQGVATPPVQSTSEPASAAGELQAKLLAANKALEDALHQKAEVDAARRVQPAPESAPTGQAQSRIRARQRQLEQESLRATESLAQARRTKLELEERMRETEAKAVTQRKRARELIERLRGEAEGRVREEEDRLRSEYSHAAEEMKRVAAQRAEAEERFERERKRLEAELEQARQRMEEESKRIREEMQAAKRAVETKAAEIRREQGVAESKLRQETEVRLRDERRRLETEFAGSIEAQEQAKRDLQSADAAIQAAQREAAQLAEQVRAQREKRAAEAQAQQAAERGRLERERQRAAAEVAAAERDKRAVEARARQAAERGRVDEERRRTAEKREAPPRGKGKPKAARAGDVAASQARAAAAAPVADSAPQASLADVEAEVARAAKVLESARAAKVQADEARERAEERIAAQHELEEELRLQLIEEAEQWLVAERERSEAELEDARREAALSELQQRKLERTRRTKDADLSLLAEVSSQLGEERSDSLLIIEESLRQREYAEERAGLARRAQEEATAERLKAEKALEEARRKISDSRD